MRYLFAAAVAIGIGMLGQPAFAEDESLAVPVPNASYHQPVFTNDRVMGGETRATRNAGTTRVELVEFELK
jgi:hypothetical protein